MSKFYVNFIVRRGGSGAQGVKISYLYKGSRKNLSTDTTDKNGEVRTEWTFDPWENREVEVFFDGGYKRIIKLTPMSRKEYHTINLPSGCFPYHTKINTPFGKQSIGDIEAGDVVLSFNSMSGTFINKQVIKKIAHEPMRIVEMKMKNGISLFVTDAHSLLTERGYVAVANLRNGDCLFVQNDKTYSYTILEEILPTNRVETVYNLIIADEFNFIADGFIAHSFTQYRKLQECFWRVFGKLSKQAQSFPQY